MDEELEKKFAEILWTARSLFERGKTAGSSANISFRHGDTIFISGSGTCFGTLKREDFAAVSLSRGSGEGIRPGKELSLHLCLYRKSDHIQAVIHTHSFYSTLWSCLDHPDPDDVLPSITPYRKMKVGTVALVPYVPPGSKELFALMEERVGAGFLLKNHGPVVGGNSVMDAFYQIEELEESAKLAWFLRKDEQSVRKRHSQECAGGIFS